MQTNNKSRISLTRRAIEVLLLLAESADRESPAYREVDLDRAVAWLRQRDMRRIEEKKRSAQRARSKAAP